MIEMVTLGGKKVGEISDSAENKDTLVVEGRSVSLEDVYQSQELSDAFNSKVKELNDADSNDRYSKRFTG